MYPSPLRLSASATADFEQCPRRFSLNYVARVPEHERTHIPVLISGRVVHEVLASFIQQGGWERIGRADLVRTLRAAWPVALYDDPGIDHANRELAAEMVARFYDRRYPADVARELGVERKHAWSRARRGIMAVGRLDRMVELADGTIEVIDYKCGRTPRDLDKLQGEPQALFLRSLVGEAFRRRKPSEIKVSFQYLAENGPPVTITFEHEDFLAGWSHIEMVAQAIQAALAEFMAGTPLHQAFPPKPGLRCRNCPFQRHCRDLLIDGVITEATATAVTDDEVVAW